MNAPVTRRALLGATAALGAIGLPALAQAVYALRTVLSEAKRVGGEAEKPSGATTSAIDALRRLGD